MHIAQPTYTSIILLYAQTAPFAIDSIIYQAFVRSKLAYQVPGIHVDYSVIVLVVYPRSIWVRPQRDGLYILE